MSELVLGAIEQLEYLEGQSEELAELGGRVAADTISRALAALLPTANAGAIAELADALGNDYPGELLAALLPGVRFPDNVDVQMTTPLEEWTGDLAIGVPEDHDGAQVVVGSPRGAEVLVELDRESRGAITALFVIGHDAPVAMFESVRSLSLGDVPAAVAAEVVMRCPSIERYHGRSVSPDLGDALATTAVRTVDLERADSESVARLVGAARIRELSLVHSRLDAQAIAQLAKLPELRKLELPRCRLRDPEIAAVARLGKIEQLALGGNPFGDGGGMALATMQVRVLDLHHTFVGDPTARALAESQELVEINLAATMVTAAGIRALAAARRLHSLWLAVACPEDLVAAAEGLQGVTLRRSDEA